MLNEIARGMTTARDAVQGFVRKIEGARDDGRLGDMAAEGRRRIMKPFYGGSHHETKKGHKD
jgi:hypothetical protein